jgi:site-specific DNA-methyltransferase (adenine-specific)
LDTWDVVVRQNEAVSILEKVLSRDEDTFEDLVSNLRPFGLRTYFRGKSRKPSSDPVELFQNGGKAWVKRSELEANVEWVDRWKVLIPRGTDGNEIYPLPVLTEPIVAGPGTACTETYLVVGPVKSKTEAERVAAYMKTRFFRFLLSLRKPTQDNSREKFSFIPRLAFDRIWTDEELYAKYGITKAEQAYIASMIKGMPS